MQPVGEITVPSQFNGPPASGNGGYAAGVLSHYFRAPQVVRIAAPIPLDAPLEVSEQDDRLNARAGDTLILSARPGTVTLTAPAPPSPEAARKAAANPTSFGAGGPSTCFVCGRNRADGDGLHIHCGRIDETHAASVWRPHANFCDADGLVRPEYIWAALDCPGGFSLPLTDTTYLLGEMSALLHKPVRAGEEIIVHAWHAWSKGRRHLAGTALHAADGTLLAQADTLWIELTPEQAERLAS